MIDLDERGDGSEETAPVWAVFGDLMAGLLGAFVLILVGVLVVQMELVANLNAEIEKRRMEEQRRMALEKALAIPLRSGRVTLNNGRIGISGSVLFAVSSDELQPDGRQLLKSLVPPLKVYLGERHEMLMVSGFTDDKRMRNGKDQRFSDNLSLSTQHDAYALLDGIQTTRPFSATCSAPGQQPVASNADEEGRAQNRQRGNGAGAEGRQQCGARRWLSRGRSACRCRAPALPRGAYQRGAEPPRSHRPHPAVRRCVQANRERRSGQPPRIARAGARDEAVRESDAIHVTVANTSLARAARHPGRDLRCGAASRAVHAPTRRSEPRRRHERGKSVQRFR